MPRCPGCDGVDATLREELAFDTVWRAYRTELGIEVDSALRRAHTPPGGTTGLFRCSNCSLDFFSPVVPASSDFYAALSGRHDYYETTRWEYALVRDRLRPRDAVADFGAGDGGFLRMVQDRVERVAGIDGNPGARGSEHSGVSIGAGSFEEFARANARGFDVVCAFHVLEHVVDAAQLMEPMLEALRPGGRLFLSVPNRDRDRLPGLEPMDAPPHHVSRWNPEAFGCLADRFGLILTRLDTEPFFGDSTIRTRFGDTLPGPVGSLVATAYEVARAGAVLAVEGWRGAWRTPQSLRGYALLAELASRP